MLEYKGWGGERESEREREIESSFGLGWLWCRRGRPRLAGRWDSVEVWRWDKGRRMLQVGWLWRIRVATTSLCIILRRRHVEEAEVVTWTCRGMIVPSAEVTTVRWVPNFSTLCTFPQLPTISSCLPLLRCAPWIQELQWKPSSNSCPAPSSLVASIAWHEVTWWRRWWKARSPTIIIHSLRAQGGLLAPLKVAIPKPCEMSAEKTWLHAIASSRSVATATSTHSTRQGNAPVVKRSIRFSTRRSSRWWWSAMELTTRMAAALIPPQTSELYHRPRLPPPMMAPTRI